MHCGLKQAYCVPVWVLHIAGRPAARARHASIDGCSQLDWRLQPTDVPSIPNRERSGKANTRDELSSHPHCIECKAGSVTGNAWNTQVQALTPLRVNIHQPRTNRYLAPASDSFIDPQPGTHSNKCLPLICFHEIRHIAFLLSSVQTPAERPTRS